MWGCSVVGLQCVNYDRPAQALQLCITDLQQAPGAPFCLNASLNATLCPSASVSTSTPAPSHTPCTHIRSLPRIACQCQPARLQGIKYALASWVLTKVLVKVVKQRPVCKHTVAVEKERLRLVNVPQRIGNLHCTAPGSRGPSSTEALYPAAPAPRCGSFNSIGSQV